MEIIEDVSGSHSPQSSQSKQSQTVTAHPTGSENDISEAETLRRLSRMDQFNRWLFSIIEPWIGQRILEVGCGLGNFTHFLSGRERIVGLDLNPEHLEEFRQRNPDLSQVELHTLDAGNPDLVKKLGPGSFDSIICLNVLEHVENDSQAIRSFYSLLEPGGHLILLVPAFPFLFGTLDLNGPHFRRYTWKTVKALLQNPIPSPPSQGGFDIIQMHYFNLFGIPGWWFCGKILKRRILPASGLGWYEKLMPLFRRIEEWTGPPLGLSIIAIARKNRLR